jgi:predicted transcriptional regulator
MASYAVEPDSCDSPLRKKYDHCELPLSKKYRSHFEIAASILDAAKYDSRDRYFLMKRTSINYAQLKKYLESLAKIGFIEVQMRGGQMLYCSTQRGLEFLRQYYVLLGMLMNAYALGKQGQAVYQTAYATLNKRKSSDMGFVPPYAR